MHIPKYDALFLPILSLLSDGSTWKAAAIAPQLAQRLNLSAQACAQEYPSGNGNIFADRVSWARSYLVFSGLLHRPKRGYFLISDLGRAYARHSAEEIKAYVKQKEKERNSLLQAGKAENDYLEPAPEDTGGQLTPQEQLDNAYATIRQNLYDEILSTVLNKTPAAFEILVVQLLQTMGYGGAVENAGQVTQYSRDNGIDGIIREDALGLDRIHIQAKRYQRDAAIGRPEIQAFAGALLSSQANKGVFITTARFSKEARHYAEMTPNTRIVLIDGLKLAEYIYHYGLGMQIETSIHIKKLDSDFWDNLQDDNNARR